MKSRGKHLRAGLLCLSFIPAIAPLTHPPEAAAADPTQIATDTVWEGDIEVEGEVKVMKGATLLLLPGTTVRFAGAGGEEGEPRARLLINGTLTAKGTRVKPIVFTSAAEEPHPGDWGGLVFERAAERPSRLSHVTVEYAVEGIRGSYSLLVIEDSLLRRNRTGFSTFLDLKGGFFKSTITENEVGLVFNRNSGMLIESNTISGNAREGISVLYGSSPTIRNNTISGNGKVGIYCLQGSSPLIDGNVIQGHERGIFMLLKSRPRIVRNEISDNETGVWAEKLVFPKIEGNVISGNGVGIYCNYSGYPELHGNNITGNREFALVVGDNMSIKMEKLIPFRFMGKNYDEPPAQPENLPPQSRKFSPFTASDEGIVDARGNWWGREAAAEMDRLGEEGNIAVIEDFHDKPDTWYQDKTYPRDRAVFSPWETAAVAEAGPPEKEYSGVKGKVIFGGKPFAGATVHAYKDAAGNFRGEGFSFSSPTDGEGSFSLHLAPGRYFLVAKKADPPLTHTDPGPGEYSGYYGGNPITVGPGDYIESNIQVVRRAEQSTAAGESGKGAFLDGVVMGPEGAVEGASLHVYTDASRQFRGPGLFGPQGAAIGGTDSSGGFGIDLPAGTYFLVASQRKSGGYLGPLRPGDLHGYYDGNPVELAPGTSTSITVQVVEKLRETVSRPTPMKGGSGIRGTIGSPSGKVPPGVYAYATTDPSFMIGAMPPFRSQPLGEDGVYFIDLPKGGTYYIGARTGYGGPPLPGEWHGFLGGETPRPIVVETGRVEEGMDFTVRQME